MTRLVSLLRVQASSCYPAHLPMEALDLALVRIHDHHFAHVVGLLQNRVLQDLLDIDILREKFVVLWLVGLSALV